MTKRPVEERAAEAELRVSAAEERAAWLRAEAAAVTNPTISAVFYSIRRIAKVMRPDSPKSLAEAFLKLKAAMGDLGAPLP